MKIDNQLCYGFVFGFIVGFIFFLICFNKKFRRFFISLITLGLTIRVPKYGFDLKHGIRFRGDPKEFPRRIWPLRHPGGPKTGKTSDLDKEALKLILDDGLTLTDAWEIMGPRYYPDGWKVMDNSNKAQAKDTFRKRISRRLDNN